MARWSLTVGLFCLLAWAGLQAFPAGDLTGEPRFTAKDELVRPEGYREWVFVGASLGMGYNEAGSSHEQRFHNLYLLPSAYQQYKKTGQFPEKTIIAMEVVSAGSAASINKQGHFEDRFTGLEASVKDSSRFPNGWAYFNFTAPNETLAATAKAFPKEACWDCHNQHGATDNVFTQFYPMLRRAK
jgi:hypothetical protein